MRPERAEPPITIATRSSVMLEAVRTGLLVASIVLVLFAMAVLIWSIVESWRWQQRLTRRQQPCCVAATGRLPNKRRSNDFRVVCLEDGCLVVRQRTFFRTIERYRLCRDVHSFQITASSTQLVLRQPPTGASLHVSGRSGEQLRQALETEGWPVEDA